MIAFLFSRSDIDREEVVLVNQLRISILLCIAGLTSLCALADPIEDVRLTDEQYQLLYPSLPTSSFPARLTHSGDGLEANTQPFFQVELTTTNQTLNPRFLDIDATLFSWSEQSPYPGVSHYSYSRYQTRFSLLSPFSKALDFSDAIRARVEKSPETVLDSMIIDGALGLNFTW